MKILFVGDVVSACGRRMLENSINRLRKQHDIAGIVVNGENAAHGKGLSANVASELFGMGADIITTGNHVWRNRDIFNLIEQNPNIIRPANMPQSNPGKGWAVRSMGGIDVGIINLIGQIYLDPNNSPFEAADAAIEEISKHTNIIFVDFHAEATSEKVAMGWYLNGRVTGVFGTHTHVQTADERILPKGTAYITDLGMTGAYFSVLGMERDIIINRFTTHLPQPFELADGGAQFNGVVVDVDTESGKAIEIERIYMTDFK